MANYRDIAFKTFWTAVAAGLAVLTVAAADIPTWWAPILATGINAATVYVRQQLGGVPPTQ